MPDNLNLLNEMCVEVVFKIIASSIKKTSALYSLQIAPYIVPYKLLSLTHNG